MLMLMEDGAFQYHIYKIHCNDEKAVIWTIMESIQSKFCRYVHLETKTILSLGTPQATFTLFTQFKNREALCGFFRWIIGFKKALFSAKLLEGQLCCDLLTECCMHTSTQTPKQNIGGGEFWCHRVMIGCYFSTRSQVYYTCYNAISNKHPSTSYPAVKHPKQNKWSINNIRKNQ